MVQKEEFDMDHMDAMKYSDLQKLAKKLGIKANMKADKLVKALKHFIELQGGSIKQDLSSAEETETETSGSDQEEAKKTKGRVRRGKQGKKNSKEEKTKKSDTNTDKVTQNERNIRKSEKVQTPNLPSATKKPSNSVQRKSKTQTPITGLNATPGKRGSYTLKTPVIIAKGSAKAKVLSQGKKRKQTQSPGKEKSASKETTSVARRSATKKPGITPNSVSLTRKSVSIAPTISKSRTPASRNTTPITTTAIRSRVSVTVSSAPSSSKRLSAGMKRKRSKTPSDKKIENADTKKRKVATPNQDKVSKEIPEKEDKSLTEQVVSEKSEQVKTPTRRQSARLSTSGVKDLVDSLTDNMSDAEMKASLMSALDKRVEECKSKGWNPEPTHIPRFSVLHKTLKQVTPGNKDWDKIHKKHFAKMDSLDMYLQKKRQRASSLNASVKKLKAMTEDMKSALTSLKKHKTPTAAKKKKVPTATLR